MKRPPKRKHTPEVTRLLHDWSAGDPEALAKLMPLVCDELRALARSHLVRERREHTLQPTALVNELYLRIQDRDHVEWQSSAQFFGFAAETMRRVLVDHARHHGRKKRGSGVRPVSLEVVADKLLDPKLDLVDLDEALETLEKLDPRQAKIVELRFFVGLTVEEAAAALGISTATVKREWRFARLWLYRELSGKTTSAPT